MGAEQALRVLKQLQKQDAATIKQRDGADGSAQGS